VFFGVNNFRLIYDTQLVNLLVCNIQWDFRYSSLCRHFIFWAFVPTGSNSLEKASRWEQIINQVTARNAICLDKLRVT